MHNKEPKDHQEDQLLKDPLYEFAFQPKESAIEELVEAKSAGKYPAAIRKAIGATMRGKTKSELEDARGFGRGVCERYRFRTADAAPPSEESFLRKHLYHSGVIHVRHSRGTSTFRELFGTIEKYVGCYHLGTVYVVNGLIACIFNYNALFMQENKVNCFCPRFHYVYFFKFEKHCHTIMRLHMTFFLAMSSAVHSQLDTPEKQNAHQPLCTRPKETPLKELVETKVDDKYPITDVDNAIRKLDRDTRDWLQTARLYTNSLCYRYNPFQPRFNESLAGRPFDFFPSATEIEPRPTWSPTCSSSSKRFYFPRTVTHDGQTCWMVFPWYQMWCPYVTCT
ncbi:unnamed protein product [Mytilus edulis]|uniref:Uncharacterized protein n=1 Tax=Mytilus edulis TaxID=6550 RepID=A0A8S3Q3D5_MYTED|nr:unnamed protein product [Mytilus edulis]